MGHSRELTGTSKRYWRVSGWCRLPRACLSEGLVLTDRLRPARRQGQAVAVVAWSEEQGGYWLPLKLD